MLNRRLHPDEWKEYFDDLSQEFQQDSIQRYVWLRVSTPEQVGLRDAATWLEFEQISYDPATGVLHVLLDGFNHRIYDPVTIWAAVKADGKVERLVIIRRDGSKDYIEFSTYRIPIGANIYSSRLDDLNFIRSRSTENKKGGRRSWGSVLRRAGE